MIVGIERGTGLDVLLKLLADRLGLEVVHLGDADFAAALQKAEDHHPAGTALLAASCAC